MPLSKVVSSNIFETRTLRGDRSAATWYPSHAGTASKTRDLLQMCRTASLRLLEALLHHEAACRGATCARTMRLDARPCRVCCRVPDQSCTAPKISARFQMCRPLRPHVNCTFADCWYFSPRRFQIRLHVARITGSAFNLSHLANKHGSRKCRCAE